jgi:hypothetical protein
VHDDGSRRGRPLAPASRLARCRRSAGRRRAAGGGQGRVSGRSEGRGGQTSGTSGRGPSEHRAPGQLGRRTFCIVTGHDDPFGGWVGMRVSAGEGHAGGVQAAIRRPASGQAGAHVGWSVWPSSAAGSPVTRLLRRGRAIGWVIRQKDSVTSGRTPGDVRRNCRRIGPRPAGGGRRPRAADVRSRPAASTPVKVDRPGLVVPSRSPSCLAAGRLVCTWPPAGSSTPGRHRLVGTWPPAGSSTPGRHRVKTFFPNGQWLPLPRSCLLTSPDCFPVRNLDDVASRG